MSHFVLRRYPHPLLSQRCHPVEDFAAAVRNAKLLVPDCKTWRGFAVAAPQVGIDRSFFVMGAMHFLDKPVPPPWFVANPTIVSTSGTYLTDESCLSLPGLWAPLVRPNEIVMRYQDEYGAWKEYTADKKLGRVLQHEIDHLNGVLFHTLLLQPHKSKVAQFIAKTFG